MGGEGKSIVLRKRVFCPPELIKVIMVRRRRMGRAPPAIPPKNLLKASTPTLPFLVSQKLFLLLRQI